MGQNPAHSDPPDAPSDTPEQIRARVREWLNEIEGASDGADADTPQPLPLVVIDPNDNTCLQTLWYTLQEARPGLHLAVQVPEAIWPSTEELGLAINPDVTLHWTNPSTSPGAAPLTEPSLYPHQLHHWVWDAAAPQWRHGHYRHAVLDAATTVEDWTRRKLGSSQHGKKLYSQAFALQPSDRPRLRFLDAQPGTARWNSLHEGAQHLGVGVTLGIRNWAAHTTGPGDPQVALEYLAALSVLARWVEASTPAR